MSKDSQIIIDQQTPEVLIALITSQAIEAIRAIALQSPYAPQLDASTVEPVEPAGYIAPEERRPPCYVPREWRAWDERGCGPSLNELSK